jgi:hypothetical protein
MNIFMEKKSRTRSRRQAAATIEILTSMSAKVLQTFLGKEHLFKID